MLRHIRGLFLLLVVAFATTPLIATTPSAAQDASPVPIEEEVVTDQDDLAPLDEPSIEETWPDAPVESADDSGNTPISERPITVFPSSSVYVTFSEVTTGGNTTAIELGIDDVSDIPDDYRSDNPRIVSIETSAVFTNNVIVCLIYDASAFSDPAAIQLLWNVEGSWAEITDPGYTSIAGSTVCGYASGLGIFAAAEFGAEPLPTETATIEPAPSETATSTETIQPTNTPSSTNTAVPSDTPTATDTSTSTSTATPSSTSTATPSDTPTATDTSTPTSTATPTSTSTATPSETITPTSSATTSPTSSSTSTAAPVPTSTPTGTAPPTSTNSATLTATASPTSEPSSTATPSATTSVTSTPSWTPSSLPSDTPSATATETSMPSPTVANGKTQFALPNVWITFSLTPASGTTQGAIVDGSSLAALPPSLEVTSAWFFDVQTTVVNTDPKELCVLFQTESYGSPSTVTLLRNAGSAWTPLTGQHILDLDSTQGTICGYTPTLGVFALAERIPATSTPLPTSTRTHTPSATASSTITASNPPSPTSTATNTPTATATRTATQTPTPSATQTTTPPISASATASPTATYTPIPSWTPLPANTVTPTRTNSPTSTPSPVPSPTNSATATNTATELPSATPTPTLEPGSFATGTLLRTTTRVNLRSGPGTSSASRGIVDKNVIVTVDGRSMLDGNRSWVPVNVPNQGAGWIAGDYLTPLPVPTPSHAPASPTVTGTAGGPGTSTRPPGEFIAGDAVRTTAALNLRSGPGTSSKILAVLPGKTIGQVTGAGIRSGSSTFYPVLFPGYPAGFVSGSYLRAVSSGATATPSAPPSPTGTGVPTRFTTDNVNMRSGPGTGYKVVAKLPAGTRVTITGPSKRSGGYVWYPVAVFGSGNGWIAGKFLSLTGPI